MIGDNAPPPEGWDPPAGRHCGQLCVDISCPVCGELVLPRLAVLSVHGKPCSVGVLIDSLEGDEHTRCAWLV